MFWRSHEGRASIAIIIGCAAIAGLFEIGARTVLLRASEVQTRIERETSEARALRKTAGKTVVIAMGNSVTLAGLDASLVERALGPEYIVRRCALEDTVGSPGTELEFAL